jgi:hypothetical protein
MDLIYGEITEKPVPAYIQSEYDQVVIDTDASIAASGYAYPTRVLKETAGVIVAGDSVIISVADDFIFTTSNISISLENEDALPLTAVVSSLVDGGFDVNIYNLSASTDTLENTIVHITITNIQ